MIWRRPAAARQDRRIHGASPQIHVGTPQDHPSQGAPGATDRRQAGAAARGDAQAPRQHARQHLPAAAAGQSAAGLHRAGVGEGAAALRGGRPAGAGGVLRRGVPAVRAQQGDQAGTGGSTTLPRVYVDPEKLDKVLCNLVSNACKFTSSGGAVVVRLSAAEDEPLIKVQDTGDGIPSQHLDQIFQRFRQLDNAASREHEGSGGGLPSQVRPPGQDRARRGTGAWPPWPARPAAPRRA